MSEDKELLAKISQLAGHINRYKNQGNGEIDATTAAFTSTRRHHPYAPPYTNQPARGGPIGRPTLRGRGGRAGRVLPSAHRNRSLVLNTSGTPTNSYEKTTTAPPTPSGDATGESVNSPAVGWVSKIDRHKQLINTSIYETETSRRAKAIEETRKTKARRKDGREKTRIMRSLQSIAVSGTFPGARPTIPDIYISGIRFRPSSDGSKLTKLPDDVNPTRSTPKKVNALDGVYIRSKNGNLYRSGLVKSKQYVVQTMTIFYVMILDY
ncbi:MAG: hypothetical protein M1812_006670 [Candelaria pacifica]|nr:MAG: hypothetical protein M1812_006670 [Candelaria pacifica]